MAVLENDPEEILVIDGGSIDQTVEIAEKMGATVLAPGRLGLGPSRKLGYNWTDKPFIAFIDADDRIPPTWASTMLNELTAGGYSALQSQLRAANATSWWGRGWNQYFVESVKPIADTVMVGRPAVFVAADLKADSSDFESLDEDTHMSRAFELRGLRQGIGSPVAFRFCEETWQENSAKWRSYGRGYREFVRQNPNRKGAVLKHIGFTIPVRRSIGPVLRGALSQPLFGLLMSSQISLGWLQSARSSKH